MKYKLLAAVVCAAVSSGVQAVTPYTLEEIGNYANAKHSYITDVNENGQAVGVAQGIFNITIDIAALDFEDNNLENAYDNRKRYFESIEEEITFTLADIEAGNINGDAQEFLQDFLYGRFLDSEYQKISGNGRNEFNVAISYDETTKEIRLFDIEHDDYNGVTRSTENLINAISDDGIMVGWGSAPFEKISFTPDGQSESETHYTREFTKRGIVIRPDGSKVELPPIFDTYGGTSIASDIVKTEAGYLISGESSISTASSPQEQVDDRCDNKDEPTQTCIESYINSASLGLYNTRATLWHLDNDLNIIDTIDLGLGITPDEDEAERAYNSTAYAVNKAGLVIGHSVVRYRDGDAITTYPVYYQNDEVIEFIDEEEYRPGGRAMAINESGIITGFAFKSIEGVSRSKFFYHDTETGETVFPADFFKSSSAIANDINENGMIVGQAETQASSSSTRRKEGFLYNISTETLTNLNDLLPCKAADGESSYPYVLAEATNILNDGTIYGSATKTVEKRDPLGNIVYDKDGKAERESIVVSVKLTPNANGTPESCPTQEQETYQRKGGVTHWFALSLLSLIGLRRRVIKNK